jgi:hypothetical protein
MLTVFLLLPEDIQFKALRSVVDLKTLSFLDQVMQLSTIISANTIKAYFRNEVSGRIVFWSN